MKTNLVVKKAALFLVGILVFLTFKSVAQPNYPREPQEAKIVYDDLRHFVEAYHELSKNSDTLAVLKAFYFDRGSAGLKEYINRHQLSPELMRDAIAAHPERYALIPDFLANISEVEDNYRGLIMAFGKVLPSAMYPPTYLLVGANRGIGQASLAGQLVTVTRVVDDMEKLRKITVHELSHFQQAMAMGGQKYAKLYSTPDNMLGLCLREGGAEFVTSLVLGDITQTAALEYLEKNEEPLKQQFQEDLEIQKKDFWLWESIGQKEYPKLLGYVMGYKICKHYYDLATDKSRALQYILQMPNAEEFVLSSRYFKP